MRASPLQIPAVLSRRIEHEGITAYPDECCGFLVGREIHNARRVEQVQPAENASEADQRFHRFSIDPRVLMDADRAAGTRGLRVLGFYHSHPDHPARPSEYDRQRAWPYYSYVIVSIAGDQALDMTSWLLDEETGLFDRQDIEEI